MGMGNPGIEKQLEEVIRLSEAAAQAFPDLQTISERAVLLAAMAQADNDGRVLFADWIEVTGMSRSTLDRFARHFANIRLMIDREIGDGYVMLDPEVFMKLDTK